MNDNSQAAEGCGVCRYAGKAPRQINGLMCRRRPPVAHLIPAPGGAQSIAVHPPVEPEGWCGEFERALEFGASSGKVSVMQLKGN